MRKILKFEALAKIVLVVGSFIFALIVLELFFRFFYFDAEMRKMGSDAIFNKVKNVTFEHYKKNCSKAGIFLAHPYFAFVQNPDHPCHRENINFHGFVGPREFPYSNPEDSFDILILGGSVATLISYGYDINIAGANYIEELLNKKYTPPHGKSFKLYNGAMPAGSQPLQSSVLTIHGSVFDAAILLDGYNEMVHSDNLKMGTPALNEYVNSILSLDDEVTANFYFELSRMIKNSRWSKYSYLAGWAYERLLHKGMSSRKAQDSPKHEGIYYRTYLRPDDWTTEQLDQWNIKKYIEFTQTSYAISKGFNLKFAHFLQPIRWFYKDLTPEEKNYEKYARIPFYEKMAQALEELKKNSNFPTFSLLRVFENEKGVIYGDHIHSKYEKNSGHSRGNRLMSEAIVEVIAKQWKLKPRSF